MKQSWISQRRTIELPGLTIDRHLSAPNELDFPGCNYHLLCLLLSDGNQQKITRIGEQESESDQLKGEFWICPAQVTGLWAWNSTDESLMFVIDPSWLNQIAEEAGELDSSRVELLSTIGARDSQIEAIAHLLQTELDTDSIGEQLYAESLMQVLMVHLLRQYCALQPKIQDHAGKLTTQHLQPVLDYIHSYLDRPLQLAQLAGIAGISQYHFCRVFRQATGVSPYQFVLQQRMEKAKELLRQRKCTIAEIALLVGYTDQSRFTRHFKRYVGATPSMFLRQQLLDR
ncbi:helix-turn-helix transcriptional regulator [Leptolyngbya sp. FACHB-541]|uniref:helix-turn-helix domain-containing protein n=1 Tax=Leptolyngbya sp. FACHB-541 TaxID=2692810 RepID=UPI0016825AC6|nr:AraC family transcriptional regulator [Leptolyngbya sp. FACHB-541]MBD1997586.1 helix-turn-helix transcriptional regulator [Leptolyngbya sp. FACHB-541]